MFNAAMRGDLGPLAQAVARYQMERKFQQEMNKLKTMETKLNEIQTENKPEDVSRKLYVFNTLNLYSYLLYCLHFVLPIEIQEKRRFVSVNSIRYNVIMLIKIYICFL